MSAGLRADVRVRLGSLDLDVSIQVAAGETLAVLGPNGAGKTTLLRTIAGLQPIDVGAVVVDGTVLEDTATGRFVPPERRPIGVVFQEHLLFPHLSARDNVAFGLRAQGLSKEVARQRATAWLSRVGVDGDDAPDALSGGQAQRVALARALATEPQVLLLDEPLAALDASSRLAARGRLRRHLAGHVGVRIVVTHDVLDAVALASRLVILEAGKVVQHGTVAEISRRPRSRYVTDLLGGMN